MSQDDMAGRNPVFKQAGDVVMVENVRPDLPPLRSTPISEFLNRKPPSWLVKNIIPCRGTGDIYGQSGSGKTFVTFDLSMACVRGVPWHDHRVKRCAVVYVLAEGAGGFINRVKAYLTHHGLEANDLAFEIIDHQVDLLTPGAQIDGLVTAIKDAGERIGPIGLLVVDTLNRTMPGGDENSAVDMGLYVRNVQYVADTIGAFVLVVHHSGKDQSRGARGHSSFKAAVDIELEVTSQDGAHAVTVRKNRDGQSGASFGFMLEQVALGHDEDGDHVNSCVVVPIDAPQTAPQRYLSGAERVALAALDECFSHAEAIEGLSAIPQGVKAVTLDQWRDRFVLRYGQERNIEATLKAFRRSKESLLKSGLISISDPYVWLARS